MRKIELATPVALFHALIDWAIVAWLTDAPDWVGVVVFLLVFQIRSVGGTSRG